MSVNSIWCQNIPVQVYLCLFSVIFVVLFQENKFCSPANNFHRKSTLSRTGEAWKHTETLFFLLFPALLCINAGNNQCVQGRDGGDPCNHLSPCLLWETSFCKHVRFSMGNFVWQEHHRFDNPHRAFTYHLHGYDSVVGPVKGVYNKENAVTKAREHNLLVSDRPAFVTILTLGKICVTV